MTIEKELELRSKIYEQVKDMFIDVDIYGQSQKKIFCGYNSWYIGIYHHIIKRSGKIKSYTIECIPEYTKSFLDKDNETLDLNAFEFDVTFIDNVIPDTYEQYLDYRKLLEI